MKKPGDILNLEQAIPLVRQWAKGKPSLDKVYIFGSYVDGTATPESDLDVAIHVINKSPGDTTAWVTESCEAPIYSEELSQILGMKVNVKPFTAPQVNEYVLKKSILVYRKEADC